MEAEEPKKKFEKKNKYITEWNMAEKDFQRYHEWLWIAENCFFKINSGKIDQAVFREFYSVMYLLYICWKPVIQIVSYFEETLKEIPDMIMDYEQSKTQESAMQLVAVMDNMFMTLLHEKQYIGLGIPYHKKLSLKQELENIRGGN